MAKTNQLEGLCVVVGEERVEGEKIRVGFCENVRCNATIWFAHPIRVLLVYVKYIFWDDH